MDGSLPILMQMSCSLAAKCSTVLQQLVANIVRVLFSVHQVGYLELCHRKFPAATIKDALGVVSINQKSIFAGCNIKTASLKMLKLSIELKGTCSLLIILFEFVTFHFYI